MLVVNLPFKALFFFFNDTATTEIYTLSLHDALPICDRPIGRTHHRFTVAPRSAGPPPHDDLRRARRSRVAPRPAGPPPHDDLRRARPSRVAPRPAGPPPPAHLPRAPPSTGPPPPAGP